ncbi:P-loop NTPase fold protein [Caulobacter sp. BP25]|uniref:P-loop NTPase fold protein n=1 Tax=Caulobacter sp. BP25 TaxID=2048900 RepID=UPI0013747E3E|nr:P-loop NTPase fold protein [Caulobacter sp. BP25]
MSATVEVVDPNAAVRVFLDAYCTSTAPLNYAVLLTGPWGAGKTHFLKTYLADRKRAHIYVSLYGVSSASEIDDQIYRQLHPALSSKYTKLGGVLARAFLKGALKIDLDGDGRDDGSINGGLPEIDLNDFAKNAKDRLLVFDDLERTAMKPANVLGYINAFVEHEDAKVVILANETEIEKEDPDFKRIKEKLIGQSLVILPSVEAAYPELLKLVTHPWAAKFLEMSKAQVLDVFAQSEANNLRVLKQALWDFERVAKGLRPSDLAHTNELKAMLQAIVALSIEVRTGRLPKEQLQSLKANRWARLFRRGKEETKSSLELSEDRYPGIDLRPAGLDPDLVVALLTRGYVEPVEVQSSLDRAPPFISPDAEPIWRRAWYGYRSTDAEYAQSMAALEAEFVARAFVTPPIIMHVFGIMLNAARIGYGRPLAQVQKDCRAYVDDLAANNRFDLTIARPEHLRTDSGYDGLGYIDVETPEFKALANYLDGAINKAWRKMLPVAAEKLHETLKAEPDRFTQQTTINNSPTPAAFWDVPLLHYIAPEEFAKTILTLEPAAQISVLQGLSARYQRGDASDVRTLELPWLAKLRRRLLTAARNLGPMSRHRLKTAVAREIDPLLPAKVSTPKSTGP